MSARRRIDALEASMTARTARDPEREAELEKAILADPEARQLALDLLRGAIAHARDGTEAGGDQAARSGRLLSICCGHRAIAVRMIVRDPELSSLACDLAEAEARKAELLTEINTIGNGHPHPLGVIMQHDCEVREEAYKALEVLSQRRRGT